MTIERKFENVKPKKLKDSKLTFREKESTLRSRKAAKTIETTRKLLKIVKENPVLSISIYELFSLMNQRQRTPQNTDDLKRSAMSVAKHINRLGISRLELNELLHLFAIDYRQLRNITYTPSTTFERLILSYWPMNDSVKQAIIGQLEFLSREFTKRLRSLESRNSIRYDDNLIQTVRLFCESHDLVLSRQEVIEMIEGIYDRTISQTI